ncbi:hypothetical protein [Aeromicrobium wangtongii]|uniref:hypothetical protein n=1 Tax=Aeromicrobium wangtongii TaxID=2969247 RepID=UPI0020181C7B|nr:hypothetical protein [Aeromicrobium wangtongii]MCL3820347.1 hypothetical protein [Aeromicrobium wangtongii]
MLTGACVYLGALSVIMAIRALTLVSSWNGENRAADFSGVLGALRDAGLSEPGAETFYKGLLSVIAVLAACGLVFAIYTARGHRSSRVGATVAIGFAGVITFLGGLGGTFVFAMIGALAVVFTIRLWTGEIRTYFRTLAGHEPPAPKAPPAPEPVLAGPHHPSAVGGDQAAPAPLPPSPYPGQQPAAFTQAATPPGHPQWTPGHEPLPKPVNIAVWTTFIGSIVAAGLSALMLLVILVGGVDYDTVMEQGGPGADMVSGSEDDFDTALRFITVLSSIAVVIGAAGLLASIRVLMKRRAGGVPLFVVTVVGLIVSVIGFPLGLPWTVATIVCLVQLRKPEARAWFTRS